MSGSVTGARSPQDELAEHKLAFATDLLRDQIVCVSGGGSGIGRATAWLAARLGATVVVCGRSLEKLQGVVDAMRARGLDAHCESVDIRDRARVEEVFARILDKLGRIDLLVNSAGGQFPQPAIDYSEKGWNAVINTNLTGTWQMMQRAAICWRDSGLPGSIVNVVVVPQNLHGVAHTCAARAGVIALSQHVAVEWAPYRIRVNCVAPGSIRSEGWAVYDEKTREKYPLTNPMMKAGLPWDVAEAIVFAGGPTGSFINGEVLTVDGGGQHWGEIWTTGKPAYYRHASRAWDVE